MENNSEKIDRYFKKRFEQFEEQPSDAVWKALAGKLGHTRKKGILLLIFRIAAGMALLFSLGIGYYMINRSGNPVESSVLSDLPVKPPEPKEFSARDLSARSEIVTPNNALIAHPEKRVTITAPVTQMQAVNPEQPEPASQVYERLASILPSNDQGLIKGNFPAGLSRITISAIPMITTQEALAMLLSETEAPVETLDSKPDHWIVGGEIAPLYSYRTLASDYLEPEMLKSLNSSESGVLAYAGGIRVAFSTSRRLSVQSGVYYSRYGQEKKNINSYTYNNEVNTTTEVAKVTYLAFSNSTGDIYSDRADKAGYDKVLSNSTGNYANNVYFGSLNGIDNSNLTPSEVNDITATQYFDYLEVPLTVKYKIIDRKFDFSLSGGLVTNFLVGNVVNLEQNGEKTRFGKTSDINQINYLGSLGLGFEYPLSSGFAFSIEPRFRYYLNPINKSSQINVHPYSFGFFAGVSYTF